MITLNKHTTTHSVYYPMCKYNNRGYNVAEDEVSFEIQTRVKTVLLNGVGFINNSRHIRAIFYALYDKFNNR